MELISVHVPKTAGSSFRRLLEQQYAGAGFLADYEDRIGNPDSLFRTDFAGWQAQSRVNPRIGPEVRCVHGHFWAGKYDGRFPEARRIVWLRDPVQRCMSHYFFWRKLPQIGHPLHRKLIEENLSLREFAEMPEVQNMVSRLFLRDQPISDFDFVGVQEFFDEDVNDLCQMMGWPEKNVTAVNRTASEEYARFAPDHGTLSLIAELNALDGTIYREALALREKRRNAVAAGAP